MSTELHLIDNPSLKGREKAYTLIDVDLTKILKSWRVSLFSFEWLTPDGAIRKPKDLPEREREKFEAVLADFQSGVSLERPILGIGVLDNVEIGSRRDVLLTLMSQGVKKMTVHIPISVQNDFEEYL
jgi:hypothetical protein